jgi:FkbM family methyltransferase
MIHPLIIHGMPTGGKGVLAALFDGHPDIFTIPLHDGIACILGYWQQLKNSTRKNVFVFPDELVKSFILFKLLRRRDAFTQLEFAAYAHKIGFNINSKTSIYFPFEFSWELFMCEVCESMKTLDWPTATQVFDYIFSALHQQLGTSRLRPSLATSMAPADFFRYEILATMYKDCKIIYIERDIYESFASTVARFALLNNESFTDSCRAYFFPTLKQSTINICKSLLCAREFIKYNTQRMMIVKFKDIILHTEQSMRKISEWLGIEFMPCLLDPTIYGNSISSHAIGVVHDSQDSLTTRENMNFLKKYVDSAMMQAKYQLEGRDIPLHPRIVSDDNDKVFKNVVIGDSQLVFYCQNILIKERFRTFYDKEPEMLEWLDGILAGSCLWDVGANIGLYSIYAAKIKKCKVYAFEPSVFNLECLARNIVLNDVTDKVCIVPVSLTNNESEDFFSMSSLDYGGALSTFKENYTYNGLQIDPKFKYRTVGFSGDTFCRKFTGSAPQYIKIDVDGIEHLVLEGLHGILKKEDVKSIFVETNEDFTEQNMRIKHILEKHSFHLVQHRQSDMISKNSKFSSTFNDIWNR